MKSSGPSKAKSAGPPFRPAWANRFATPSLASLLHPLKALHAPHVRHARSRLLAIQGMNEVVAWQGVWRWTLVYSHPSLPGQVWAFLVPDPSRPLLAVPVAEIVLPSLPTKHLTRPVRDGLVLAPVVGGVRWASWEVTSNALAENVLAIAASRATIINVQQDRRATTARRAS